MYLGGGGFVLTFRRTYEVCLVCKKMFIALLRQRERPRDNSNTCDNRAIKRRDRETVPLDGRNFARSMERFGGSAVNFIITARIVPFKRPSVSVPHV